MTQKAEQLAREIAREAHAGQVDKLGRDYLEAHLAPIAAGAALFESSAPRAEAAAWLHDVLEDTDVTARELADRGVAPDVVSAVESVTRRPGEAYERLIDRACAHPVGRYVKLVDNAWNLASNPELAEVLPERAHELRAERYLPARVRLLAATGLHEDSPEIARLDRVLDERLTRLPAADPPSR